MEVAFHVIQPVQEPMNLDSSQNHLGSLTNEVLINIISYLSFNEMTTVQILGKRFYYLINSADWISNYFWKTLIEKKFFGIKSKSGDSYQELNFREEYKKLQTDFIYLLSKNELLETQQGQLNFFANLTSVKIDIIQEESGLFLKINDMLVKFPFADGSLPPFLKGVVITNKYFQDRIIFHMTCVNLDEKYCAYEIKGKSESCYQATPQENIPEDHFRIRHLGKNVVLIDLTAKQVVSNRDYTSKSVNINEIFKPSIKINQFPLIFQGNKHLCKQQGLSKVLVKDTDKDDVFLIQESYSFKEHGTKQISWIVNRTTTHYLASPYV